MYSIYQTEEVNFKEGIPQTPNIRTPNKDSVEILWDSGTVICYRGEHYLFIITLYMYLLIFINNVYFCYGT